MHSKPKSRIQMAWTEQCKIAFDVAAKRHIHKGMKVKEALKLLSEESGIPFKTLERWYYSNTQKKIKNLKNEDICPTNENSSENEADNGTDNVKVCSTCNINPARPQGNECHSCKDKKERNTKLKRLHQIGGHIRSLKNQLEVEGNHKNRWANGITKTEYAKVMEDVFSLIETWKIAIGESKC